MATDKKLTRQEIRREQQKKRAEDKEQAKQSLSKFLLGLKEQKLKYTIQYVANSQFKNKDGSESKDFAKKEDYSITIYIGETLDPLEAGYPCKIFMDGTPEILFYVNESDYTKLKALFPKEVVTLNSTTEKLKRDLDSIKSKEIKIENADEVSSSIAAIAEFSRELREQESKDDISDADRKALALMKKEVQELGNTQWIIQEVASFSDKVEKAKDLKQIEALKAELLGKIDKIQNESIKDQLREKVIAIVKFEMRKRRQYELLAEALENKDSNLELVSLDVVSSDEKADDHMIYIAEKVDDKGAFIGYRCKITGEIGKAVCRFSISLESEEHKKIHTIIEAQKEAEVIAAPFKEKLDKAKTQESIEKVMYSFSQEVEITANEMIQQKLSVINEEMGKIASQKFQGIQDIVESEVILRAVYELSKELNVLCDCKLSRSEPEESGFFSTLFGSNETQFEELEVVIEIRKKIEEIDEKLKSTENDQVLRILKEANSIANKALNYTGIFFKGTDSDKAVAKKELEKLLENKSPLISSSSDKIARKGENSKKGTSTPNISEMSDVRKSDEEKAISNCNSLLEILEKKQPSEKYYIKAQFSDIKELLRRVDQFNFQSSILSDFIKAVYPNLNAASKKEELTVEDVKQLYAYIRLKYSELLNAAQELASSDVKAAQERAYSKAKAAQELASSNAEVAEKAVLEKSEEKGENEKQIKEVEEKLKSIEETEKSIKSIEEIKKDEAKKIRLERKLLLGDIKEYIIPVKDEERIKSTIADLEKIVENEFNSLNDYSLTDEQKKIKIGTEVFDEKVEGVINTLELLQHDITQKISDCDKEIEAIEAKIKDDGEKAPGDIQDFIESLIELDTYLMSLEHDNTSPLRKVLGGATENLNSSLKEIIKPQDRIMLLEMEKRNISDAIEKSLQDKTHKLIIPSHEGYAFPYNLEQKKAEKNKLKGFLSVLGSICSTIKDKVKKFLVFRRDIYIGAVLSIKQAEINREKANEEKIKQSEQLAVLIAQKDTLERDLSNLVQKKDSAIAERNLAEITISKELADVEASISAERARFETIISAERARLEAIISKPFQLFIVTHLSMNEDRFRDIKGNAVILDDKNKVHFIIDGKKVLDKNSKSKEVTINDRQSIPLAAKLQISFGEFKEVTDYSGVCDVIKQAARNGGYNLQYDTKAEEIAEDKAIRIREAREKGVKFKEEAQKAHEEAEYRAAQEARNIVLAQEVKKKASENETKQEEKQAEPTKPRTTVTSLEYSLAAKRERELNARKENEAKQAAERAALETFGALTIDGAAKRFKSNTPQEVAMGSVDELIVFVSELFTKISRLCANDKNLDESQTQSKAQLEQILAELTRLSNAQNYNFGSLLNRLREMKAYIEGMKDQFKTHEKLPFDACIESLDKCIVNFGKWANSSGYVSPPRGDSLDEIAFAVEPVTSGPPHSPVQPRPTSPPPAGSPIVSSLSFFGTLIKKLTPEPATMAQNLGPPSISIPVKNG